MQVRETTSVHEVDFGGVQSNLLSLVLQPRLDQSVLSLKMLWDIQLIMQRRIPEYISYHFGLKYLSSKFLKGAHWQPVSCCSMSAVRSLRFMQVALSFLVFSRAVAEGPEGALPRHLDDGVLQKVCSRADLASVFCRMHWFHIMKPVHPAARQSAFQPVPLCPTKMHVHQKCAHGLAAK